MNKNLMVLSILCINSLGAMEQQMHRKNLDQHFKEVEQIVKIDMAQREARREIARLQNIADTRELQIKIMCTEFLLVSNRYCMLYLIALGDLQDERNDQVERIKVLNAQIQ